MQYHLLAIVVEVKPNLVHLHYKEMENLSQTLLKWSYKA